MKLSFFNYLLLLAMSVLSTNCGKAPSADSVNSVNSTPVQKKFSAIIGGQVVDYDDPIRKRTVFVGDTDNTNQVCAGAIISQRLILTAAHCLKKSARNPKEASNYKIAFLLNFRDKSPEHFQVRNVVAAIPNENYASRRQLPKDQLDIGLVKIEGTIPTGYEVPQIAGSSSELNSGAKIALAGYGKFDPNQDTDVNLRSVEKTIEDSHFSETEFSIDQHDSKGACHGDSGGPSFLVDGGMLKLIGIARGGYDVGDINNPSCQKYMVYTKVSAIWNWIKNTAASVSSL